MSSDALNIASAVFILVCAGYVAGRFHLARKLESVQQKYEKVFCLCVYLTDRLSKFDENRDEHKNHGKNRLTAPDFLFFAEQDARKNSKLKEEFDEHHIRIVSEGETSGVTEQVS